MPISSIPKSTQPTQPPTPRYVELKNSSPETERLAQLVGFLEKYNGEGVRFRTTSTKGETTTTLYLAKDAEDSHKRDRDKGSRNRAADAKQAWIVLGNLLRACGKEKIVDGTDPGAKPNGFKAKIRSLLNNAIGNTTGTLMGCFRRSSPPPAPLASSDANLLVRAVAEKAKSKVPDFPDTVNKGLNDPIRLEPLLGEGELIGLQDVPEHPLMSDRAPNGFEAEGSAEARRLIKATMAGGDVGIEKAVAEMLAANPEPGLRP